MLNSNYVGSRFRIEILPNYEFNFYCLNGHKETRAKVDEMSLHSDELRVTVNNTVHKFLSLCGFWVYAGPEE